MFAALRQDLRYAARQLKAEERRPNGAPNTVSYPNFVDWRQEGALASMALLRPLALNVVIGEGMLTVAGGIAAGLVAGAALSRVLITLLYQVRPEDPATFTFIVVVIAGVALGACALAARRALRVDPATTLRAE